MTVAVYAEHLGNGVGQIRLPLPFPGLKWTNAYVIEGDAGLTLIDCGIDSVKAMDIVVEMETAYEIEISDAALADLNTLQEVADYVQRLRSAA